MEIYFVAVTVFFLLATILLVVCAIKINNNFLELKELYDSRIRYLESKANGFEKTCDALLNRVSFTSSQIDEVRTRVYDIEVEIGFQDISNSYFHPSSVQDRIAKKKGGKKQGHKFSGRCPWCNAVVDEVYASSCKQCGGPFYDHVVDPTWLG